jgi:VWFA-related protein
MTRRSAVKLLASAPAWAQGPQRQAPPPPSPPSIAVIDAVVVDPQGSPVRNLGPADFTISERAEVRAIASFAAVDTVSGAARLMAPLPLPMKIDPGEVHRTFVLVVDDAGISAAAAAALRDPLMVFVNQQIGPRDPVALIRTSGGMGPREQLTSEKPLIRAAIETIVSNPAARPPSEAPWMETLNYVLEALRAIQGRKAVVLFWERTPAACDFGPLIALANRAWCSLYPVHCGGTAAQPACAIDALAAGTGGLSQAQDIPTALARILESEASYYLLGFPSDPSFLGHDTAVSVKLSRPGLELRARVQPAGIKPRPHIADSGSPAAELRLLLVSPMEAGSLPVRVTALFSRTTGNWLDVLLWVDPHDLTFTHRLNGLHTAGLDVLIRVNDISGLVADDHADTVSLSLESDAYQQILAEGVRLSRRVPIAQPGVFAIRAAVRDSTSTHSGIAHRLIEVPDVSKGELVLSGIALLPAVAADDTDQAAELASARRVFQPGQHLAYTYFVYNAAADGQNRAQLEVRTALYIGSRMVYESAPTSLAVSDAAGKKWLSLRGTLELGAATAAGEFVLEVLVSDMVKPRTATQWTDFTLR